MVMTVGVQPPTLRLPPIAEIATFSSTQLFESLRYLHSLYQPQVRGSRRRRRKGDPSPDDKHDDAQFRSDAFERAYTIRWLTALVSQLEVRQGRSPPTSVGPSSTAESNVLTDIDTDADHLIQQTASLLAICAGVAAAGTVRRRFTFQSTLAGEVHVALTDIPLDNHNYGSVGAQTWGGACVLAEMIAEDPIRFGLGRTDMRWSHDGPPSSTRELPLRILELGAGTGLVGLTVAKLLHASPPSKIPNPNPTLPRPGATIVLTDFYSPVLDNLRSNIGANFPAVADDTDPAISIDSHPLDWSSFSTTEAIPDVLSTPFDVVFGADIVYEAQHAVWIRDCLKSLLSYPDESNDDPAFHLVIPLRPTHTFESSTIEEVFGSRAEVLEVPQRELAILSKESIICEAYGDRRSDDVEYVYYRIGWTQ